MLYSKHNQISTQSQGNTLEQGLCYDNFSATYDNRDMLYTKLETIQIT